MLDRQLYQKISDKLDNRYMNADIIKIIDESDVNFREHQLIQEFDSLRNQYIREQILLRYRYKDKFISILHAIQNIRNSM